MKNIHSTWDFMRPTTDENLIYNDFNLYLERVYSNSKLKHIPEAVLTQWICTHNKNLMTIRN
jgi:hypothetical protein